MILEIYTLLEIVSDINEAYRKQTDREILKFVSDGDYWTVCMPEMVIANCESLKTASVEAAKNEICRTLKTLLTSLSDVNYERENAVEE